MRRWAAVWVAVLGMAAAAALGSYVPAWTPTQPPPDRETTVVRACPAALEGSATQELAAWAPSEIRIAPVAGPQDAEVLAETTATLPTGPTRVTVPVQGAAAAAAVWAESGPDRGLTATSCVSARTDAWFVGARSDDGHQAAMELVNLDATDAEVALSLYGPDGLVPAAGSRGISVPARGSRTVPLGPLVQSADPIAVRVQATVGRVAGFLRVRRWDGSTALGADWVPESASPSGLVLVPGVPGGAGERTLLVTNPGERVAPVEIEILGDTGSHQAVGAEDLDVPPGATRVVDLEPGLAGQPGSVLLRTSGEIAAAVEVSLGGDPEADDRAMLPARDSLGEAATAVWPGPTSVDRFLVLANPQSDDARVQVAMRQSDGSNVSEESIVIPARGSVSLPAPAEVKVWEVVSAAAGLRGTLVASGKLGEAGGITALELRPNATSVEDVVVVADPHSQ
ncbi:MAG: DUF5719 family protein [Propioniciclava sp.]